MNEQKFVKIDDSLIVDELYADAFKKIGMNSIDDVFTFAAGQDLTKKNLASYRSRSKFETDSPESVLFLKKYNLPPICVQLKNWLAQKNRTSCGRTDFETSIELSRLGINTAKAISFGEQMGLFFERRSFSISEQIPNAESIERKLPDCFNQSGRKNRALRKKFIKELAEFIKKFHNSGYRHRDLYFSHIFYDPTGRFYLIDLSRVFKPLILIEYFRIKDVAELHYSAPGKYFSDTDKLRFYFAYAGCDFLSDKDKRFIKKIIRKARRIERHDKKHKDKVSLR